MATKYEWDETASYIGVEVSNAFEVGQSFTVGETGTNENFSLSSIVVYLYDTVSSPNNIYIELKAVDGSGLPTGSALSTGSKSVAADYDGTIEVTMSSYTLQASTKYVFIVKTDYNDTLLLGFDFSGSYDGGALVAYDDPWLEMSYYDLYFQVWGTTATATGTNMKINISDTWKDVDAVKINIGDTWKEVISIKQNIGDSWKTVY